MALDVKSLVDAMRGAGEGLGGNLWPQMSSFALPELEKIAIQIKAIGDNIADYTPEGAKALLDMQVHATVAVIVAMTTLALLDVQQAINQILSAVKGVVNGALGFTLI
jgi:Na+/H+-translocating membrane pyrophosphatase